MIELMTKAIIVFTTLFVIGGFSLIAYLVFKFVKENIWKEDEETTCSWRVLGKSNTIYTQACRLHSPTFYNSSDDGLPVTDWATHCPYCGNKIVIEEIINEST